MYEMIKSVLWDWKGVKPLYIAYALRSVQKNNKVF